MKSKGFVYLMQADTGHYKIGRSVDPVKRLKVFNTEMPVQVNMLHVFPADNAIEAEAQLHHEFRDKRYMGEWFSLEPADIRYIGGIIEFSNHAFSTLKDSVSNDARVVFNIMSLRQLSPDVRYTFMDTGDAESAQDELNIWGDFTSVMFPENSNLVGRFSEALRELIEEDAIGHCHLYSLTAWAVD